MSWVVQAVRRDGALYVALQVGVNEPRPGAVLVCEETGGRYKITSIALPSNPTAWEMGRRSVQLESVGSESVPLTEGMHVTMY
jgi:hypothetical protein